MKITKVYPVNYNYRSGEPSSEEREQMRKLVKELRKEYERFLKLSELLESKKEEFAEKVKSYVGEFESFTGVEFGDLEIEVDKELGMPPDFSRCDKDGKKIYISLSSISRILAPFGGENSDELIEDTLRYIVYHELSHAVEFRSLEDERFAEIAKSVPKQYSLEAFADYLASEALERKGPERAEKVKKAMKAYFASLKRWNRFIDYLREFFENRGKSALKMLAYVKGDYSSTLEKRSELRKTYKKYGEPLAKVFARFLKEKFGVELEESDFAQYVMWKANSAYLYAEASRSLHEKFYLYYS